MFILLLAQLAVISSWDSFPQIERALQSTGADHVRMLNIMDRHGVMTFEAFRNALEQGAREAPMVMSNIGPISEEVCNLMAQLPQTAFIMTAGNEAIELDFPASSTCWSKNILFVGTTNPPSNWGKAVRIRVKAANSTEATALVGGRLAVFAARTSLLGMDLISGFLTEPSRGVSSFHPVPHQP